MDFHDVKKRNVLFLVFAFCFIVNVIEGFNYKYWDRTLSGWLNWIVCGGIVLVVCLKRNRLNGKVMPFEKYIRWMMIIPCLALFGRMVVYEESPWEERHTIVAILAYLFFYLFYLYKVSERQILKLFTVLALVMLSLQIVQQFDISGALFGVYRPDSGLEHGSNVAEVRNGLYRFRLPGIQFVLFCMYYYWVQLLLKVSLRNMVMFGVFLMSVYLTLTRQVIVASLFTLLVSVFFVKSGRMRMVAMVLLIISTIVLIRNADSLFAYFFEMTQNEDTRFNPRTIAFGFYVDKIVQSPISFFFGNGHPYELARWQQVLGLYPSDIGLVGEVFHYGIFIAVLYFSLLYSLLFRYRKCIPLYIRLLVLGTAMDSILIFPYRASQEYFFWAAILYIAGLHVLKNRQNIPIHN